MLRKTTVLTALSALALLLPAAALGAGSTTPRVPTCTGEAYKPAGFTVTCGDGGIYFSHLRWVKWTNRYALAKGSLTINHGAGARPSVYSVDIQVLKAKRCPGLAAPVFSHVDASVQPAGHPIKSYTLYCPSA